MSDWDPVQEATSAPAAPVTVYPDVAAWVEQWWVRIVRRPGVPWCPRWWAHPEAASRLGALWAAWEAATAEGGAALSSWWVYHADGHLVALHDPRGPFAGCANGHRDSPPPAAVDPLPSPEVLDVARQ